MTRPTHHQFVKGIGHISHASEPEIPPGYPVGSKNCLPPPNAKDGSIHLMNPSHGAPPMRMRWLADHKSWASLAPDKGNRMAWSTDHLMRAGWEYLGPDTPGTTPPKGKKRG